MVRVGINGFGRIGRLVLRAGWDWPELDFVHINEIKGGTTAAAHLLKFDSVHGRWEPDVAAVGSDRLRIDNQPLTFSDRPTPGAVPWADLGVDLVLECSGQFRTPQRPLPPTLRRGCRK
jgi:glyceraldehyde 3-phosphate dehydrogenase